MSNERLEAFVRGDPVGRIYRGFRGPEQFWGRGVERTNEILSEVGEFLPGRERVVDIGCGVGRHLIPMAQHFRECLGVDISPKMLELLGEFAAEQQVGGKRSEAICQKGHGTRKRPI